MKEALYFGGGLLLGIALMAAVKQANTSTCCQRVAFGARDTIAGLGGPAEGVISDAIDAFGLTKHLPSILDTLGVPLDA